MYRSFYRTLLCCLYVVSALLVTQSNCAKIVALLPARNERPLLEQCIRALAQYADAIVYLDDASTDESCALVESLADECRVEKIIKKKHWKRDEPGDRNLLLQAGRALGGTHFIVLDADELFTANCLGNNFLRSQILALNPGDKLVLNWIALWRSVDRYRFDSSVWSWNYKDFIFCDDGTCSYNSDFIHTSRTPGNLTGSRKTISGYTYGVLHFQFVNWRNLLLKQAWYRCLEHIKNPQKSIPAINNLYAQSKNEDALFCAPSPDYWFSGYSFFNAKAYEQPEQWREKELYEWFKKYGISYFKDLDIWDIDWDVQQVTSSNNNEPDFDRSMGTHLLRHNQKNSPEEYQHIYSFCKNLYNTNNLSMVAESSTLKIPKIIHQIWIGGPLPEMYNEIQKTWAALHPDWEYILWTDEKIAELQLVNQRWYDLIQNNGFKADLARYEILNRFGGVYVDMDAECIKPLDTLHYRYNFYTGIARNSLDLEIANALIGTQPGHPIIQRCIELADKQLTDYFARPNRIQNVAELISLVGSPTFTKAILQQADTQRKKRVDIIFPITFFYPWFQQYGIEADQWHGSLNITTKKDLKQLVQPESFAMHYWAGSWWPWNKLGNDKCPLYWSK